MTASRWRQAAGAGVLAVLLVLAIRLTPVYLRNRELQQFVDEVASRPTAPTSSDDVLRAWILDRAAQLDLPVTADNIHLERNPGRVHIDVRYAVRVDLPLYTVDLHFYPGAGSR